MNRKIEPREQLVIDRLLDAIPSVSGSLREQLASAKIEDDGDFSMIKFAEVLGPRVNVPRVPVEAVTRPLDDPSAINVLLHVKNGMLFILECYRNDGGSVEVRDIDVDKLDVFSRVV